jgi:hypothetical protein
MLIRAYSYNSVPLQDKLGTHCLSEDDEDEEKRVEIKKRRKSKPNDGDENIILKVTNELKEHREERERKRDQRHKESLEIKQQAIDSYNDKMDQLLKKL